MKRHYLAVASYALLLITLMAGCDIFDNNMSGSADKPNADNTSPNISSTTKHPVDLSVTPEMLEQLKQQETNFLATDKTLPAPFQDTPKENNLSVSGKLHLNDDEEDYIEAVEGAEIKIEVKFE